MRCRDLKALFLMAMLFAGFATLVVAPSRAQALSADDPDSDLPLPPQMFQRNPGAAGRPGLGHPPFTLDGVARDGVAPVEPGRGDAAAEPEAAPKPPSRAEMLDKLMTRLAKTSDAAEAQGIAGLIEQIWMRSGSDTADLLMTRVVAAINGNRHDVAEALLGQILVLQPDWAEAWNKRATLRFLDDDDTGSMEDISHVLALEPRHFGAISGMGFILERHGETKAALTALRRALDIYPENLDVRKAVEKLAPDVDGRDL